MVHIVTMPLPFRCISRHPSDVADGMVKATCAVSVIRPATIHQHDFPAGESRGLFATLEMCAIMIDKVTVASCLLRFGR
jgi:hypothetical protein